MYRSAGRATCLAFLLGLFLTTFFDEFLRQFRDFLRTVLRCDYQQFAESPGEAMLPNSFNTLILASSSPALSISNCALIFSFVWSHHIFQALSKVALICVPFFRLA